jgi:hypothetical protein
MTDQALVSVPAIDLAAVMPFRAHGDVRYYLDGVLVEPCPEGGCMIVATEGHMLAAVHSPEARADCPRILKVSEGLEEALKRMPSRNRVRVVSVPDEKGRITLHDEGVECYVQARDPFIDGKYPDWRKVIPPVEYLKPGVPAALQALYLTRLWKASREERHRGVFFSHDSRNPDMGVTVIQVVNRPELIILIMAMKFDRQPWPQWMPREPQQEPTSEPTPEVAA